VDEVWADEEVDDGGGKKSTKVVEVNKRRVAMPKAVDHATQVGPA
jgi:hypothetical protein